MLKAFAKIHSSPVCLDTVATSLELPSDIRARERAAAQANGKLIQIEELGVGLVTAPFLFLPGEVSAVL